VLQEVQVQLHLWPWSVGDRNESIDLSTGEALFPFYGSPVMSASTQASFYLPQRHENFIPFGPIFKTVGGEYQIYEIPYPSHTSSGNSKGQLCNAIRVHLQEKLTTIHLCPQGARLRRELTPDNEETETRLARTILAWSQFFDDLIEASHERWKRKNRFPWPEIFDYIGKLKLEVSEPRMALIVLIATRIHHTLRMTLTGLRKVLVRERLMLPAGKVSETDQACLLWYIRQPGETMAQKATANRQALLGITRKESYDTLENRVLKDFLRRSIIESKRYLDTEVGNNPTLLESKRAKQVRSYRNLCASLKRVPYLEGVQKPPPALLPNYVLQNDHRYRQVWQFYVRLLRREDEEDCMWDWQSRTWADVARFLVNAALYDLTRSTLKGTAGSLILEELFTSAVHLLREQHLGSRLMPGSEPGPFVVRHRRNGSSAVAVLEVVHPDLASEHPATQHLGRMGGHLYIVLTPLSQKRKKVIVVWAIHTAGAEQCPPWEDIAFSAQKAFLRHANVLGERLPNFPELHAFVVASDLNTKEVDLHDHSDQLHLAQVATDQRCWEDAIAGIAAIIEDIIGRTL